MFNKKGQFYLLAAIILIAIIVSFVAVTNYSKKNVETKVNDLGKELGVEGGEVLDYGTFTNEQVQPKIEDFALKYSKYTEDPLREIVFVYGNPDDGLFTVSSTQLSQGGVQFGSSNIPVSSISVSQQEIHPAANGDIKVPLNGQEYTFNIKPGENFYFIIRQQIGENNYVVQG